MQPDDEFREFVIARTPALLRTAWMLTGDAHAAQDLLQSAFIRTWPHWSRVRDDHPDAYVRVVMVRLQAAWWRRRWRAEVPTSDVPDAVGTDPADDVDVRDVLRRALAALPMRQRHVVVLRHYEDLTEAQVADVLGCSVGTVKSQNAKGLAKLRLALAAAGEREGAPHAR